MLFLTDLSSFLDNDWKLVITAMLACSILRWKLKSVEVYNLGPLTISNSNNLKLKNREEQRDVTFYHFCAETRRQAEAS